MAMNSLLTLLATISLTLANPTSQNQAQISVNTGTQFQSVDGFGFSEAFQRAEDVAGKEGLSARNRTKVLDLLFSDTVGAGLNILRNGIGSSNSSMSNFMNSIEPFSPGLPSSPPHYTFNHNDSGQLWMSEAAQQYGVNTFYGDAWSAPGYMKTNDDDSNGGYLCGVTNMSCKTGDWKEAYANYLVEYVRFYQQSGVKVTHLGFLNEPQEDVTYASMLSDGEQAADFIRVLGRTVKAAGLDIKLTCCDGVGWEQQAAMLPGLKAGGAEDILSVITAHGYSSPPTTPLDTKLPVWETEWADLSGAHTPTIFFANGGPGEGLTWAAAIQTAFVDANVSAFLYWIGAENANTGNSALINMDGDSYIASKRLWAFAQFSRFVKPGAVRVQASSSDPLVTVSSFLNAGNQVVATQVLNNATVDYQVTLDFSGRVGAVLQTWLTNNDNDLVKGKPVVAGKEGKFVGVVPARSIVSFVS